MFRDRYTRKASKSDARGLTEIKFHSTDKSSGYTHRTPNGNASVTGGIFLCVIANGVSREVADCEGQSPAATT